jgi:hypothetical protein
MKKTLILSILFLVLGKVSADPSATTPSSSGQFEVVDVSGQIAGEPDLTVDGARSSWTKACQEWKTETKDLNKNNEVLGINCNTASCNTVDTVKTQCSSTGTYKVKTAGVRVNSSSIAPSLPEPPVAAQLPPDHEITTAPPQVIVEAVPAPRIGFLWLPGYWGWEGRRHVWIPGRWTNERPGYVWTREHWERHGRGWHFEAGHWDIRH